METLLLFQSKTFDLLKRLGLSQLESLRTAAKNIQFIPELSILSHEKM